MFVDEEVYLDYEIDDFLEHYGVKGMHWGIRNEKKIREVARKSGDVAKTVGRGTKKTYEVAKAHPRTTGAVAAVLGYHFLMGRSSMHLKYKAIRTGALAYAGARFAQSRVDKHKKKKWSELNMPDTTKDQSSRDTAFIYIR
jgi:hypothetical protein